MLSDLTQAACSAGITLLFILLFMVFAVSYPLTAIVLAVFAYITFIFYISR
jgi:hypothetical protein